MDDGMTGRFDPGPAVGAAQTVTAMRVSETSARKEDALPRAGDLCEAVSLICLTNAVVPPRVTRILWDGTVLPLTSRGCLAPEPHPVRFRKFGANRLSHNVADEGSDPATAGTAVTRGSPSRLGPTLPCSQIQGKHHADPRSAEEENAEVLESNGFCFELLKG